MKSQTAKSTSRAWVASPSNVLGVAAVDDFIQSLEPDPKFDAVLRVTNGAINRVAVYYHAAYLEFFGQPPPFGPVPSEAVKRIASILELEVPEPFEYPSERRTFFKHAEKARRVLGWKKFARGFRSVTQEWLDVEARRSDDPDYLLPHESMKRSSGLCCGIHLFRLARRRRWYPTVTSPTTDNAIVDGSGTTGM